MVGVPPYLAVVHPEPAGGAQVSGEPESGASCDARTIDDFLDPLIWRTDGLSELVLGYAERLEEFSISISWMSWRSVSWNPHHLQRRNPTTPTSVAALGPTTQLGSSTLARTTWTNGHPVSVLSYFLDVSGRDRRSSACERAASCQGPSISDECRRRQSHRHQVLRSRIDPAPREGPDTNWTILGDQVDLDLGCPDVAPADLELELTVWV